MRSVKFEKANIIKIQKGFKLKGSGKPAGTTKIGSLSCS
jgi:hypothetical protein